MTIISLSWINMRLSFSMIIYALIIFPVSAETSRSPYYASQFVINQNEKLLSRCLLKAVQNLDDGLTSADKIGTIAAGQCDKYFRDYVNAVAGPKRANGVYYETRSSVVEEATRKLLIWRSIKRNGG